MREQIIKEITEKVMIKLAEQEKLASHNVKLALVDEFNKEYENALNIQAKAETTIVDYNDLANKII